MAESDRERARRLLQAVRALPPGVLETVAARAPAGGASLIAVVRRALGAADPEAALAGALRGAITIAPAALGQARAALADTASLAGRAAPVRASLETLLGGYGQLAAHGAEVREAIAGDDPALAALVDRALALLGDDGPFAALRGALDAVRDLERTFGELARGEVDAGALAQRAAELRTQRASIGALRDELARVPSLVAEARAHAEHVGDAAAVARLAAVDAALREGEPGGEARWQDALDRALAAELAPLARDVSRRIALASLVDGALESVAAASERVAELAARLGDAEVELSAVGDQALALARLPGAGDKPRELVARARAVAEGDAVRTIRVHLLAGMVDEQLGDLAGARRAFRKVMEGARAVDGVGHELGWAALHLGQLEAAAGQRFRAGQDLELAQDLGDAARDLRLYALAASARIDLAADRPAAEALLDSLGAAPPALRDALRARVAARWRTS